MTSNTRTSATIVGALLLAAILCAVILDNTPERRRTNRVAAVDSRDGAHARAATIAPDSEPPDSEFAADPQDLPHELGGIVVDEGGAPVVGADIYVLPQDRLALSGRDIKRYSVPTKSDDAGRFTIETRADPELVLVCRHVGYVPVHMDSLASRVGSLVEITLQRGMAITGRIVDLSGTPMADVSVRAYLPGLPILRDSDARPWSGPGATDDVTTTTDDDGRFTIAGLGRPFIESRQQRWASRCPPPRGSLQG